MAILNFLGDFKVKRPLHWFLLSGHYLVCHKGRKDGHKQKVNGTSGSHISKVCYNISRLYLK